MPDQDRLTALERVAETSRDLIDWLRIGLTECTLAKRVRDALATLSSIAPQPDRLAALERENQLLREAIAEVDGLAKQLDGGYGPQFPPAGVSARNFLAITGRFIARRRGPQRWKEQEAALSSTASHRPDRLVTLERKLAVAMELLTRNHLAHLDQEVPDVVEALRFEANQVRAHSGYDPGAASDKLADDIMRFLSSTAQPAPCPECGGSEVVGTPIGDGDVNLTPCPRCSTQPARIKRTAPLYRIDPADIGVDDQSALDGVVGAKGDSGISDQGD